MQVASGKPAADNASVRIYKGTEYGQPLVKNLYKNRR